MLSKREMTVIQLRLKLLIIALASASVCFSFQIIANAMELSSPAISEGSTVPDQYTCKGADTSPPLNWSDVPQGAKTLTLIVEDPDAPGGTFVHWVVYNLPPDSEGLPAGVPRNPVLREGGNQGVNDFGKVGYNGPCPPPGGPHHYRFRLYALDKRLEVGNRPKASDVEDSINGHVKATAQTVGLFSR